MTEQKIQKMKEQKIVDAEVVETKTQEQKNEIVKECATKLQECLNNNNCKLLVNVRITAERTIPQVFIVFKDNDNIKTYNEEQNKLINECKIQYEEILNKYNCGITAEMNLTEKGNIPTIFYFLKK